MIGLHWLLSLRLPTCFKQQTRADFSTQTSISRGWRSVHVKVAWPVQCRLVTAQIKVQREILVLVRVPNNSISSWAVLPLFRFSVDPAVQGRLEVLRELSCRSAPGKLYNRYKSGNQSCLWGTACFWYWSHRSSGPPDPVLLFWTCFVKHAVWWRF